MDHFESELAEATNASNGDLLGAIAIVIDNEGNFLYRHAAGRQFLDSTTPLDQNCAISLTSAGKFFTNIAALQLVERGIITLDEPINKFIPEIDHCLLAEELEGLGEQGEKKVILRRPTRGITLRDLLVNTSGMGCSDDYEKIFGSEDRVPPPEFPEDAHNLAKMRSTHLFFEPGEGFNYGWSIYYVQLLVERYGGKPKFVQYADEYLFGALGMTTSTYLPAQVPHVWERRLQAVERKVDAEDATKSRLVADDESTQGLTCSISDIALFFSDIMSPNCKLLQKQEHRDMLFTPQLAQGGRAHQSLREECFNYGFLLPLKDGESPEVAWKMSPPPAVNWTVAGVLFEEDDGLPGLGIPRGTVSWEGLHNVAWTMNREKGRMMLFCNQVQPGYDVKAHNLVTRFMHDAWKTFGQ